MNRLIRRLTRMGVSVWGSRELRVRGRASGQWRATVVNLLDVDGKMFLVAPRGETQWVRNVRAQGEGELRVGRRVEAFTARELADSEKLPVLRAYIRRWGFEVGQFFEGVDAESSDQQLMEVAPGFPVFALTSQA